MVADNQESEPVWSVYLVRCANGALYTGITTDIDRRLAEHGQASGRGAKFLRGKGPLRLVLKQELESKGLALSVERRIKKLSKARKEALIDQDRSIQAIVSEAKRDE